MLVYQRVINKMGDDHGISWGRLYREKLFWSTIKAGSTNLEMVVWTREMVGFWETQTWPTNTGIRPTRDYPWTWSLVPLYAPIDPNSDTFGPPKSLTHSQVIAETWRPGGFFCHWKSNVTWLGDIPTWNRQIDQIGLLNVDILVGVVKTCWYMLVLTIGTLW